MPQKSSLLPLWLLISIFLAPVLASIIIHSINKDKPLATTQNGIFIQEPFYLDIAHADNLINKNWSLVFVEPTLCQNDCLAKKQLLHNLHKALGKDQVRVKILAKNTTLFSPNSVIILNPQGMAIMYYEPRANPAGILKDIRKLLKNSHV